MYIYIFFFFFQDNTVYETENKILHVVREELYVCLCVHVI